MKYIGKIFLIEGRRAVFIEIKGGESKRRAREGEEKVRAGPGAATVGD